MKKNLTILFSPEALLPKSTPANFFGLIFKQQLCEYSSKKKLLLNSASGSKKRHPQQINVDYNVLYIDDISGIKNVKNM